MSSPNTISPEKLARLIGRPDTPALIDVCTEEDFAANPRLVPGAVRRPWAEVPSWGPAFVSSGRPAVAICKKGRKLSQGVAAWLRHEGVSADVLEGGITGWQAASLPTVPADRLPHRDAVDEGHDWPPGTRNPPARNPPTMKPPTMKPTGRKS